MTTAIRLRLPATLDAARLARGALVDLAIDSATVDDAVLLTSEVVTNVLLHAGLAPWEEFVLHAQRLESAVRVEVCDPGRGFDLRAPEPVQRERGGFGLFLVDRLASRWGVHRSERTCVWFELDVCPAA